jgi:hypothetical protein
MTRDEAKAALDTLNATIALAVALIADQRETLDRFFAEARDFDTLGPILDPTLWNDSERRTVAALLTPIYRAERNFVDAYADGKTRAEAALAAVKRDPE